MFNECFQGDKKYTIYGSPFFEYLRDFKVVMGEMTFAKIFSRPRLVVLDLMSPTDTLREIFRSIPKERLELGLAVSLEDLRPDKVKRVDDSLGICQIAADLADPLSMPKIRAALGGRKADLILERAKSGLNDIPTDPEFYSCAVRYLWSLLSAEGILLLELPSSLCLQKHSIPADQWVTILRDGGISVRHSRGGNDWLSRGYQYIMVVKTPQSPQKLPHLPF